MHIYLVDVEFFQLGTMIRNLHQSLAGQVLAGEQVEGLEGGKVAEHVGEGLVDGTAAGVGALHLVAVPVHVQAARTLGDRAADCLKISLITGVFLLFIYRIRLLKTYRKYTTKLSTLAS